MYGAWIGSLLRCFGLAWPLMMGPVDLSEMSVTNHQNALHKILEEWRSHLHCSGSM